MSFSSSCVPPAGPPLFIEANVLDAAGGGVLWPLAPRPIPDSAEVLSYKFAAASLAASAPNNNNNNSSSSAGGGGGGVSGEWVGDGCYAVTGALSLVADSAVERGSRWSYSSPAAADNSSSKNSNNSNNGNSKSACSGGGDAGGCVGGEGVAARRAARQADTVAHAILHATSVYEFCNGLSAALLCLRGSGGIVGALETVAAAAAASPGGEAGGTAAGESAYVMTLWGTFAVTAAAYERHAGRLSSALGAPSREVYRAAADRSAADDVWRALGLEALHTDPRVADVDVAVVYVTLPLFASPRCVGALDAAFAALVGLSRWLFPEEAAAVAGRFPAMQRRLWPAAAAATPAAADRPCPSAAAAAAFPPNATAATAAAAAAAAPVALPVGAAEKGEGEGEGGDAPPPAPLRPTPPPPGAPLALVSMDHQALIAQEMMNRHCGFLTFALEFLTCDIAGETPPAAPARGPTPVLRCVHPPLYWRVGRGLDEGDGGGEDLLCCPSQYFCWIFGEDGALFCQSGAPSLDAAEPLPAAVGSEVGGGGQALSLVAVCISALWEAARLLNREGLFFAMWRLYSSVHAHYVAAEPVSTLAEHLFVSFFGAGDDKGPVLAAGVEMVSTQWQCAVHLTRCTDFAAFPPAPAPTPSSSFLVAAPPEAVMVYLSCCGAKARAQETAHSEAAQSNFPFIIEYIACRSTTSAEGLSKAPQLELLAGAGGEGGGDASGRRVLPSLYASTTMAAQLEQRLQIVASFNGFRKKSTCTVWERLTNRLYATPPPRLVVAGGRDDRWWRGETQYTALRAAVQFSAAPDGSTPAREAAAAALTHPPAPPAVSAVSAAAAMAAAAAPPPVFVQGPPTKELKTPQAAQLSPSPAALATPARNAAEAAVGKDMEELAKLMQQRFPDVQWTVGVTVQLNTRSSSSSSPPPSSGTTTTTYLAEMKIWDNSSASVPLIFTKKSAAGPTAAMSRLLKKCLGLLSSAELS